MLTGKSKAFVFGSNSHGQLGLGEASFFTPTKTPSQHLQPSMLRLDSIKEVSLDNSSVMKKPDDSAAMKEYILELETKLRESEAAREALMAKTTAYLGALERQASDHLRLSAGGASRSLFMMNVERVGPGHAGIPGVLARPGRELQEQPLHCFFLHVRSREVY